MILGAGIHDGVPMSAYQRDNLAPAPSLNSGTAKLLLNASPLHAWYGHPRLNPAWQPENRTTFDRGTAAHALLLGDETRFAIIEAADWKKKAAQKARDAAYADGRTPLLEHQFAEVKAMVAAARIQLGNHKDAHDAFTDGKPEQTLLWQEPCGTWCRARLDWLPNKGARIYDYKTVGDTANPELAVRRAFDLGRDMQAAFHTRGFGMLLPDRGRAEYLMVLQECQEPYALSVVGFSPRAIEQAHDQRAAALAQWRHSLEADIWPGYAPFTAYVDVPAWLDVRREERKQRSEMLGEMVA